MLLIELLCLFVCFFFNFFVFVYLFVVLDQAVSSLSQLQEERKSLEEGLPFPGTPCTKDSRVDELYTEFT